MDPYSMNIVNYVKTSRNSKILASKPGFQCIKGLIFNIWASFASLNINLSNFVNPQSEHHKGRILCVKFFLNSMNFLFWGGGL